MLEGIAYQKVSTNISLLSLDLKVLSDSDLAALDENIVQICEGNSGSSVASAKSNLLRFLSTKDKRTQYGAVAEFFVHLLVRHSGLRQEFLFRNLEEGSIKKGFDGCFSDNNDIFLLESKSGGTTTSNISHRAKVKEAYCDICSVVSGVSSKSQNNPWRNAYNHASHIDLNPKASIRKQLKELSDKYDSGKFHDISNFKVIVASTIFQEPPINANFHSESLKKYPLNFSEFKAKECRIFCITKSTFEAFLNYLDDDQ